MLVRPGPGLAALVLVAAWLAPTPLAGQLSRRGETWTIRSHIDARSSAPLADVNTPAPIDSVAARLDRRIPALMDAAEIPGLSVALVRDGQVVWTGAYGVRNIDSGAPVTDRTLFQAASLSKPVFAYTVMRLVERGVLDPDRPLHEYLPNPRMTPDPRYRRITARMVLSHSTGLPNWAGDTLTLAFDPGSAFRYSGEGYMYLQQVVESLAGAPLDELARREVLDPFGMTRSSYVWRDDFQGDAAVGHDAVGRPQPVRRYETPNAAYSLLTTAGDYARFVAAILERRGLRPETFDEMLTPVLTAEKLAIPDSIDRHIAWALGWGIQRDGGGPEGGGGGDGESGTGNGVSLWHWGDNGTFRAFVALYPERELGLVYFANSIHGLAVAEEIVRTATGTHHWGPEWADYERYDDPARVARRTLYHAFADDGVARGESMLAELRERQPDLFGPRFAGDLASLLRDGGHTDGALAVLTTAIVAFPDAIPLKEALGLTYVEAGRSADAVAAFREVADRGTGGLAERAEASARWVELRAEAAANPVVVPLARLRRLAGDYGPRHILVEGDTLFYQRDGNPRYQLIPLGNDVFQPVGLESFRIRFDGPPGGVPGKIVGLYLDGSRDETPRDPTPDETPR